MELIKFEVDNSLLCIPSAKISFNYFLEYFIKNRKKSIQEKFIFSIINFLGGLTVIHFFVILSNRFEMQQK